MNIHLRVPGRFRYRDLAIQAIAAACRLVTEGDNSNGEGVTRTEPGILEVRSEFAIRVVSSFSEIFNNVVKHSYNGGTDDGFIDIRVEIRDAGLRVELEDSGNPFVMSGTPQLPATPEESGRGLFIVRAFVDEMAYTPGPPNRWSLEINEQPTTKPNDVFQDI